MMTEWYYIDTVLSKGYDLFSLIDSNPQSRKKWGKLCYYDSDKYFKQKYGKLFINDQKILYTKARIYT